MSSTRSKSTKSGKSRTVLKSARSTKTKSVSVAKSKSLSVSKKSGISKRPNKMVTLSLPEKSVTGDLYMQMSTVKDKDKSVSKVSKMDQDKSVSKVSKMEASRFAMKQSARNPQKSMAGQSTMGTTTYGQSTYMGKAPPSQKCRIIGIVSFVAFLLLMVLGVGLYFFLLEIEKYEPPTLAEITPQCQKKFGNCWYSKLQYVNNCSNMPCTSLTIDPYLTEQIINTSQVRSFRLSFVYNKLTKNMTPKNHTPCRIGTSTNESLIGWCENEKCKTDVVPEDVTAYKDFEIVDGTWIESTECIGNLNATSKAQSINWKKYWDRKDCKQPVGSSCTPFRLVFRSCSAPSRSGKPCWNTKSGDTIGNPSEWPVTILNEPCPNCEITERPIDCTKHSKIDKCAFYEDDFNVVNEVTDFRTCCNLNGNEIGKCLLGTCFY